jgi:CPA1 family monovalent cation:H+ antiporter
MSSFDAAAILITVAAVFGYLNFRFLKLPSTTGVLIVALVSSIVVIIANAVFPGGNIRGELTGFVAGIDFNEMLMHGMLCFLLFAGALQVEMEPLLARKWSVLSLASIGVLISTALIAGLMHGLFQMLRIDVPLRVCFVFGALMSPTDPVAVIGMLRELKAPKELEAEIAGESLFNDGVGVVVFVAMMSLAGLLGAGDGPPMQLTVGGVSWFALREIGGGVALGLIPGYAAYRALKSIDHHPLELLITLSLVMFIYSASFRLGVSGPIAVVVAGLLIGNPGRRLAMSPNTVEHLNAFWGMVDEILNAVLFLLVGLEVFAVGTGRNALLAALAAIPIALFARGMSVGVPVACRRHERGKRRLVAILTWSGLRGGISVALVLSLPPFPAKNLLLTCCYAVVVFSIVVQGLTMRRLLRYCATDAKVSP